MNKRRKTQISEENKEESISKPKKNTRKKMHLTRESDLDRLTQASQTSHSLSIPEVYEECKENLDEDQELSSAKLLKDYSEWKELDYTKVAIPSSHNRKLIPTFTKSKKSLIKRQETCFEETTAICTKEGQHVDKNVSETANTVQNPVTSAESSVTKMESARDQIIPHCDRINERPDIKIKDKYGIRKINNNDVAVELLDSHPDAGIEPNSQASSYEKEMSQKQVSFSLCVPSNNDENNSEKKALSIEPLKYQLAKQMNESVLPEDMSIDHIKSGQNVEECLDSSGTKVQQDKSMQIILKADETDDPNWINNGNGKDSRYSECMDSQTQKMTNVIQLPVIADIFIPTPGKLNSSPCTTRANKQRNADVKETEGLPGKSGKSEEQNNNCTCSNNEISAPGASKSALNKKASDQQNLETNGKLVEKGVRSIDSCRKLSIPAEQNSIKNQGISGKDFPYVQPVTDPCLEKEVDHSEPICDQFILKDSLICSQFNEGVLTESRKISLEDTVCVKENIYSSTEPNVPTLLIQKENTICSEHLVLNVQQSELRENNLIMDNIMNALPSGNVVEKTVKVSKAEPKPRKNVFFSSDINMADEESAQCEGNGSKLDQVESNLHSVEILPPQLLGDPNKEVNLQSKMQESFAAYGPDSSSSAPNNPDMVAQAYSPCPDSFSVELESLSDTPLEGIPESHGVEFQSQKTCVLNDLQTCFKDKSNQYTTRKQGENKISPPDSTEIYANNVRDGMKLICDPSKQEDATEVVYGLIKELSNLNRLIMSTHRDLDSFKRLKSRRNKQHGRLPSHGMNNTTSMVCTVKKKREL